MVADETGVSEIELDWVISVGQLVGDEWPFGMSVDVLLLTC